MRKERLSVTLNLKKKWFDMTLNHNYGYFSGVGSGIAGNGLQLINRLAVY